VAPLLLAGTSGRLSGVVLPFAVAAVALAACGALQHRGRPVAAGLYFVAGLAIVYGILAMLAVPLRLAVVGTCLAPPAPCGFGLERPLTQAESSGLAFAIGMGIVGLLVGFFGLVVLYRRPSASRSAGEPPCTPPTRRIAPVVTTTAPPPAAEPEPAAKEPAPQAHAEELELPAHTDDLELPAHLPDGPAAGDEAAPPQRGA